MGGERIREESAHAAHTAELKERLRLDYIERFGKEPEEEKKEETLKDKPAKVQALHWINALKKHPAAADVAKLRTCIKTLILYCGNARENPEDPKYHCLKKGGKAFSERVAPFADPAFELLRVVGFDDAEGAEDAFKIKGQVNGWLLGEAVKFLNLIEKQL